MDQNVYEEFDHPRAQLIGAVAGAAIGLVLLIVQSGVPSNADDVGSLVAGVIAFSFIGAVAMSIIAMFAKWRGA